MAWTATKLMWRWHHWRPILLLSLLLLASLATFAGGTVARLFTPYIYSTTSDVVRLQPSDCGITDFENRMTFDDLRVFRTNLINPLRLAETRVTQCAGDDPDPLQCGLFLVPKIMWNGSDTSCPFAREEYCINDTSTPYRMDTGLFNSAGTIGINAKQSDTVDIRMITECSPVHNIGFVTYLDINDIIYADDFIPNTRFQLFHFGAFDDPYSFSGERDLRMV